MNDETTNYQFSNENKFFDSQEWLEENYPQNGTCLRENDKENFGKNIEQIRKLHIWPRKLNLENHDLSRVLSGSLDLSGFVNLDDFNCSCNKFEGLILPRNNNLKKFNCSSNLLFHIDFGNGVELEQLVLDCNCLW